MADIIRAATARSRNSAGMTIPTTSQPTANIDDFRWTGPPTGTQRRSSSGRYGGESLRTRLRLYPPQFTPPGSPGALGCEFEAGVIVPEMLRPLALPSRPGERSEGGCQLLLDELQCPPARIAR